MTLVNQRFAAHFWQKISTALCLRMREDRCLLSSFFQHGLLIILSGGPCTAVCLVRMEDRVHFGEEQWHVDGEAG